MLRVAHRLLFALPLILLPLGCSEGGGGSGGGTGASGGGSGASGGGTGASGGGSGASGGGGGATAGGGGSSDAGAGEPLEEPIPNCMPDFVPSGDFHQDCVDRINQFRAECQNLPPYERWTAGEACADAQAEYDSTDGPAAGEDPHAGWQGGVECEDGWAQNECPGWGSGDQVLGGCLQGMWDEGPGENFQLHGHYINMSSTSYTEVACGFYEAEDGKVWAVMNFR